MPFVILFPPPLHQNLFYGATLSDLLWLNCISHQISASGIRWGIVFSFGVWSLWLQQNRVVFKDHNTRISLMIETLTKASEFAYLGLNDKMKRSVIPIQVQWLPSPVQTKYKWLFNGQPR